MDMRAVDRSLRFADRVAKMLERVECRPAISATEREAAYRLRYEAYLRRNLLTPRLDAMLYDERYDPSPSSLTTITYIDGELASTVRMHVVADLKSVSPANDVFPDVLKPLLSQRRLIIEPARLAARAEMAERFPELPYFALRPPWMAAQHFNADFIVLSCACGHEGFYRRVCGHETWSGARSYPKVNAQVVCMGLDFAAGRERVEARYPSYRSEPAEREALLGKFSSSLRGVDLGQRDPADAETERISA
jgi:hypothetical protein